MANTIKLKRGSGSNPSASDLSVGEVALRTDGNPKLFTKNDDGNVLEVGLVESGSITSTQILDGTIVNADINASAAIAGTKISPNFGSQNIVTTGTLDTGNATLNRADVTVVTDGSRNNGVFIEAGDTGAGNRPNLVLKGAGSAGLSQEAIQVYYNNGSNKTFDLDYQGNIEARDLDVRHADFSAGIDVTGNISVTGTVDGVDIAARNTLFGGLTASSGVLTNGVTATTQSASDNSTKVATTAYTDTAISNLVDSSPSTLNTLNELAAALGDDANFSTTVTNSIATKLPLAGGTLVGNLAITREQPIISFNDSTDNPDYYIGNIDGAFRVRDTTNNSTRLDITASTTTISNNLDVGAGIDVTGQADLNIASNSALTEPLMIRNGGSGSGTNVGMVFFNGNGTSTGAGALAKIKAIDVGSFDADLVFETALKSGFSTGGTVERFRIKSDGNIGIGTDSPGDNKVLVQLTNSNSNDFEVVGGSSQGRTNINLKAGNATSGSITAFRLVNSSGTGIGSFQMDNSTDDIDIFNGSQGGKIFFHTNESGSSLVKMTITDTGRVGINTASPSEKLEVNGTVKATAFSGDGSALTGVVASGSNASTLDNLDSTQFLRSDAADTASGDIGFGGGAGAVTILANSDLSFNNGTWTGNTTKIQHHNNFLYIVGGSNGIIFREGGTDRSRIDGDGHFRPATDSTYNLGLTDIRWANVYADNLHGTGANITGVNAATLDSLDSTSFLRSDAADTASGDITFSDNGQYPVVIGSASGMNDGRLLLRGSSNPYIRFREGNTDKAYIGWHSDGYFRIVNDESGELLKITSGVNGLVFKANGTEYTVYHTGNDGSGSTLDSDKLDGEEGSYYRNASNINAGTVPVARLPQQESGASIVGNFGQWQAHSTYNNFNTEPSYWGWNYVNGNTNAPNSTSSQWYRCRLSLGSEYGKGTASGDYSLEMAIPRFSQASAGVLHVRTIENGAENAWVSAGFPSGTRMIFQQTSAPTGWTKDTTDTNQRALRVVSGSVGSGGNINFTTAFASRGVSGTIDNTTQGGSIANGGNNTNNASISTNNGGNNTNNGGNNTNSSSISISVNNHTLSTAQMPSHTHRGRAANHDTNSAASQGYPAGNQHNRHRTTDRANNQQMAAAAHDNTGSTNSHNHGLSQNSHSHSINSHSHSINAHSHSIPDHSHSINSHGHTFTGSAHNHSFSGTSINMAVLYVDVIIAQKD